MSSNNRATNIGRDPVWYRDVRVLWQRAGEFFPARDQTAEERVNSIVRMLLYVGAAVFAYNRQPRFLVFAAMAVAVVSLAYRSAPQRSGDFAPACRTSANSTTGQDGATSGSDGGGAKPGSGGGAKPGSAGGACVGRDPQPGSTCTWSTPQNPFANVLLTEYRDDPDRPPACDYDVMKRDIRRNFNSGLIRDAADVHEKQNSQRQYYTMPVTTTYPDTQSFAEFCYGTRAGCKQNTRKCTGHAGW